MSILTRPTPVRDVDLVASHDGTPPTHRPTHSEADGVDEGAACPVSYETIDARAARLSATATAVLLVLFVMTGAWPILALVVVDYVVRVTTRRRAPLGWAAAGALAALGVPARPMDRAPKVFAWNVGFLLALLSLVLVPMATTPSLVVAGVLAAFSALDGVGNVCVGCLMYRHVVVPLRTGRPGRQPA